METLIACLTNWKTTLIGFVAGIALYVVANGVKMPTDAQGWWTFGFAALVAGLGFVSKDATTGSRPKLILVPLLALALTGCGITGMDFTKMSAEQIAAFAKMKDAWGGCVVANTPYGRASSIWVNADKGVLGEMTIKENCETTIKGPAPKP